MISYTIWAKNLYPIAATLIHLRIPFEFKPHKAYLEKGRTNGSGKSVIEFELVDDGKITLANVLYEINEKYGSTFGLTILNEFRYK